MNSGMLRKTENKTNNRTGLQVARKRVLLLVTMVLLLTAALALLVNTTNAKYRSGLWDYTSAVAGDFFFTSNYLGEDTNTYSIPAWDGEKEEITFTVRAYENSLRYNTTGTDLIYYIQADLYTDRNLTNPATDYDVTVECKTSAQVSSEIGTYSPEGDSSLAYPCARIAGNGLSMASMMNYVTVTVEKPEGSATDIPVRYLDIRASVVPMDELENITLDAEHDDLELPERGLFSLELSAFVALGENVPDAEISTSVQDSREGLFNTTYTIRCSSLKAGKTGQKVRIYYSEAAYMPDSTVNLVSHSGDTGWSYFECTLRKDGNESITFLKTGETVLPNDGGVLAEGESPGTGVNLYCVLASD